MKAPLTQLEEKIREYFTSPKWHGFCTYFHGTELYCRFREISMGWPLAIKNGNGELSNYFVPASEDNREESEAARVYDAFGYSNTQHTHPMRKKLANFIIRDIARKQKKKFVPIE